MKISILTKSFLCIALMACSKNEIVEPKSFEGNYSLTDTYWGGSCTTPAVKQADGTYRNIDWKKTVENSTLSIIKIENNKFEIKGLINLSKSKVIGYLEKDTLIIKEQPVYQDVVKLSGETPLFKSLPVKIAKTGPNKIQAKYSFGLNYSCSEHEIIAVGL
jgi:hypothetical protein